jgi:AcrR family transcriptional regulator
VSPPQAHGQMSIRRQEIVAVARQTFASKGYQATSMRDIANACGLTSSSLYSHFRSKSALLELIILPFFERFIPEQIGALETGGSGREKLEEMMRRTFIVACHHPEELSILHYEWWTVAEQDESTPIIGQIQKTTELWERAVRLGIEDTSLRPGLDIEVSVRVIMSAMEGLLDPRAHQPQGWVLDRLTLDELTGEYVAIVMPGLRAG